MEKALETTIAMLCDADSNLRNAFVDITVEELLKEVEHQTTESPLPAVA